MMTFRWLWCLPFTITQSALILSFFATAGLQYLHRPFLSRTYFQTDTRLFMGGFLSALGTYPEILGESLRNDRNLLTPKVLVPGGGVEFQDYIDSVQLVKT